MRKTLVTALATPFFNGEICAEDYAKLLEKQRDADEILCVGTTAEGGLLTECEKKFLVFTAKNKLPEKKIWAGISSGCTAVATEEANLLKNFGADGFLVTPPSFFKCTKHGFIEHILRIRDKTHLPIMLYNAPSRCGYALWQDTVEMLAKEGIYLKDAGSDIDYAKALAKKIPLFCGNEELLEEFVKAGARGCVSVVGNVAPKLTKRMLNCDETGAVSEEDKKIFHGLVRAAFSQINPIAVKYMLFKIEIFSTCEVRLPLTSADEKARATIDEIIALCEKLSVL